MTSPVCSVDGCSEPVYSKKNGLCHRHWWADRRGVDLTPLGLLDTCSFEGCDRPASTRGLCPGHYMQSQLGKSLTPLRAKNPRGVTRACSFDGCDKKASAKGLCYGHYAQQKSGKTLSPLRDTLPQRTCEVTGCDRKHDANGLCEFHYGQARRDRRRNLLISAKPDYLGAPMPKKTISVLTDDFDGEELPEGTQPITLSMGRNMYVLYLSEDNHGKLLEALNPFIEGAETVSASTRPAPKKVTADAERNAKVRHWAIDTAYEYENAKGETVTLGERGRIPEKVVKAWEEAGSPDIS